MLGYMIAGGWLMWVLFALSIVGLAIVIDRWQTFKLADIDPTPLRREVLALLQQGKVEEAIESCRNGRGPVAAILHVGLTRYLNLLNSGRELKDADASVAQCMQDYAPHIISKLEKRIGLLVMIGSIAPLVGMLGTVVGMIQSFSSMSQQGLGGMAVAAGISVALITTAGGLIVAVPVVILYHYFLGKVEHHTLVIEESASELVEFIHLNG